MLTFPHKNTHWIAQKTLITVSPCKECKERNINCHSKCERYLEFAEYRKRLREHNRRISIAEGYGVDRYYALHRIHTRGNKL